MLKKTIFTVSVTATIFVSGQEKLQKPNVLFILSDDHQADLLGALEHKEIHTPNIDKLVTQGTTFTNMHAFEPSCTPSRASILSGCNAFTHGATYPHYGSKFNKMLIPYVWTKVMQNSGYQTMWTGKWNTSGGPTHFGIEILDSIKRGGMGPHLMTVKDIDGNKRVGFSSELFADAAIRMLDGRDKDKPFFLTVAFTAPHDPRTPPKRFKDMYKGKVTLPINYMDKHPFDNGYLTIRDEKLLPPIRTKNAVIEELEAYYGMITHMDTQIGRVLEKLNQEGLTENTIVIYTSDNGLAVGQHGLLGKFSMYQHSSRVPFVISGPQIPTNVKNSQLGYLRDIYPTVCELVGIDTPEIVEGKSLTKIINNSQESVHDTVTCMHSNLQRMIRNKRYKLIRYYRDDSKKKGSNRYAFFDILKDPSELNDLINHPELQPLIRKFKKMLTVEFKSNGENLVPIDK